MLLLGLARGGLEMGMIGKQIVGLEKKFFLVEGVLLWAGQLEVEILRLEEVVFRLEEPEVVAVFHL